MCLTDKMFLQTHVTFCEYLVFHEFKRNLYITLAKYLEQEGIANLLFSVCLYTVFLSSELISWDDSSRLLDDISDMFFIAPCLANLSDKDHTETVPSKTQSQYPCTWYNVLNTLLYKIYPLSFYSSSFSMHRSTQITKLHDILLNEYVV